MNKIPNLKKALTSMYKADLLQWIHEHPEEFDNLVRLSISDEQPYAWRAAWLLWDCMEEHDPRLSAYLNDIIHVLEDLPDNQLRELLKVILKLEPDESQEGYLFDFAVNIWENPSKSPGVRYISFQVILKIISRHPDLQSEISILTRTEIMSTFSPAVSKSILKRIRRFI